MPRRIAVVGLFIAALIGGLCSTGSHTKSKPTTRSTLSSESVRAAAAPSTSGSLVVTLLRTAETTTTTAPPSTPSAKLTPVSGDLVTEWMRVGQCEEGGRDDPNFGFFGIYPSTWRAYGGTDFAPTAGGASLMDQITVAVRIEGQYVPDQQGCTGGW